MDSLFFPMMVFIIMSVSLLAGVAILLGQRRRLLNEINHLRSIKIADCSNAFGYGDPIWPGLAKVVEEAGETLQVLGKLIMVHGHHAAHWDGDLIAKIEEEIPDLKAALDVFVEINTASLNVEGMDHRYAMKHAKFHEWNDEGKFERLMR